MYCRDSLFNPYLITTIAVAAVLVQVAAANLTSMSSCITVLALGWVAAGTVTA